MADLYYLICVVAVLHVDSSETSRQNLALNKTAWISCGNTWNGRAANTVDGNNHTCIPSPYTRCVGNPKKLVLDLQALYHIVDVSIHTKGLDPNPSDFVIEVYERNPTRCQTAKATICKNYTGRLGSFKTISCERAVFGRYVRLMRHRTGVFTLCEIKVYGLKPDCLTSNYIRIPGRRQMSSPLARPPALSRVSCVQLCLLSGACVGVNYNSRTRECQLLLRPEPTDTVAIDPDWVYYGDDMC